MFHSQGISYYPDEKSYQNGEKELGYLHMDDQFTIKCVLPRVLAVFVVVCCFVVVFADVCV